MTATSERHCSRASSATYAAILSIQVARMRQLPIFTVVNKMDRPALNGFEIIESLEKEFNLQAYPVNWYVA